MKINISIIGILLLMFAMPYASEFKTSKQKEIESILMAPCCGGGTMAEHEDNRHTYYMKKILTALTDDDFNREKIIGLFKETYSNPGIYKLHFSPARKKLDDIIPYVEKTIHPDMTLDEIVELFTWIHDTQIRSMPQKTGIGHFAWKMPIALLIIGTVLVIIVIRNYTRKPAVSHIVPQTDAEKTELEKRIEKEMKELNI